MPPVSGIGNPVPTIPPTGGGHGDHGANAALPGGGQSFSATLAQAVSQAPAGGAPGANGAAPTDRHKASASIPNGGTHPEHLPIGGSKHGGKHGFQESALGLRAYRQQLIAANIANADTPNYQAVDIDFQEALRIARSVAGTSPVTLATAASGHIAAQALSSAPPYPLKYHTPSQAAVDGNTVEMDVERAKFAENAMMYEFSLDRVSGHFKHRMELLQSLKD